MKVLLLLALLVAGCANPNYVLRSGVVTTIDLDEPCAITVQDPDPIVILGPSTFEVACDRIPADLVPGDQWPPK